MSLNYPPLLCRYTVLIGHGGLKMGEDMALWKYWLTTVYNQRNQNCIK